MGKSSKAKLRKCLFAERMVAGTKVRSLSNKPLSFFHKAMYYILQKAYLLPLKLGSKTLVKNVKHLKMKIFDFVNCSESFSWHGLLSLCPLSFINSSLYWKKNGHALINGRSIPDNVQANRKEVV